MGVRERSLTISLNVSLKRGSETGLGLTGAKEAGHAPFAPRQACRGPDTGSFTVVNRARSGAPEPFFERPGACGSRRGASPTARSAGQPAGPGLRPRRPGIGMSRPLRGCSISRPWPRDSSPAPPSAEVSRWWLDTIARHRVRITTWTTYDKQLRVVGDPPRQRRGAPAPTEQVAAFLSHMVDAGSAARARNIRTLLVQVLDEAVNLGLAEENVAKRVRPPRVPKVHRRTLSPAEVAQLLDACDERYVAAVALCFVQGWRISEALGLAWQDLDLDAGTVRLRRVATYADGIGMMLGADQDAADRRAAAARANRRRATSKAARAPGSLPRGCRDRLAGGLLRGRAPRLVFTNPAGRPVLRQHVDRAIRKAAGRIGSSRVTSARTTAPLGRHQPLRLRRLRPRRVARFVGHADVSTTKGYVQTEGERPRMVSQRALELLDPRPVE